MDSLDAVVARNPDKIVKVDGYAGTDKSSKAA